MLFDLRYCSHLACEVIVVATNTFDLLKYFLLINNKLVTHSLNRFHLQCKIERMLVHSLSVQQFSFFLVWQYSSLSKNWYCLSSTNVMNEHPAFFLPILLQRQPIIDQNTDPALSKQKNNTPEIQQSSRDIHRILRKQHQELTDSLHFQNVYF